MATAEYSGAAPAHAQKTTPDHWPTNAVEAPPPARAPRFPDDVMRATVSALKHHGELQAAKYLRRFYPILSLSSAQQIVGLTIKPAAVAFARAVAHAEAAAWRWEHHWKERLVLWPRRFIPNDRVSVTTRNQQTSWGSGPMERNVPSESEH